MTATVYKYNTTALGKTTFHMRNIKNPPFGNKDQATKRDAISQGGKLHRTRIFPGRNKDQQTTKIA